MSRGYHHFKFTLICPKAMVIAAADVNPLMTGTGMKSTRKPGTKINKIKFKPIN